MSSLQAEGLCLRFPENLPPHASLSHEVAVQMLGRAISLATQIAFQPSYIDKPPGATSPPQLWSDLPVLPFLIRLLQMAKYIFSSSQVVSIFHKMASGTWNTSNDTPSHSRPDAYVTCLPPSVFVYRIHTFIIDRNLKSWRHVTALHLFQERWPLRASVDDTVSSRVATHSSSSFTIRADNRFVSTSFLSISLMTSTHTFYLCNLTSRPARSASTARSTVPVAPA